MRTALLLLSLSAAPLAAADAVFERQVAPVLAANCAACHSETSKTSGFSVASRESVLAGGNKHGAAVAPGKPLESVLVKMVKGELAPRMPFGKTLDAEQVAAIENWIRALPPSAATDSGNARWAFRKPVAAQEPADPSGWARNGIDRFVRERQRKAGLTPAPQASKRVLARRIYFDLVGMPPAPAELDAYLSDSAADATAKLIDRLLADARYGERWGRHWLDVVRYGESSGLEGDGAIGNAWRYRDWVIQAFNDDMPYDRFTILQIGGADEHSKTRNNYQPDIQGHIPLGFLRVAPWDRSNLVADEVRQNYLNEVTTTVGSVFLGLSVGCARCHDHKYDPIPTKDFYRLQAFFSAVQVEDKTVPFDDPEFAARAAQQVAANEAKAQGGPERLELTRLEKKLLDQWIGIRIEAAKTEKPRLSDVRLEMRRKDSPVFTAAERRKHGQMVEDTERTQDIEEKKLLEAFESQMLARFEKAAAGPGFDNAARFRQLTVDDVRNELFRESMKWVPEEEKLRYKELNGKIELYERRASRWRPQAITVVNVPGPPSGAGIAPTHVLRSGDYRQPGEAVEPGYLSAVAGNSEPAVLEMDRYRQFPTRGRRLTLAKWIASPENPLTARVMVNRIWQQYFGKGIVETASDFGKNGARPTHPELLDWLALRFIESGWSMKQMHRLILNSATYQQASENPAVRDSKDDPASKLLWKYPRRRLEAEEIRDGILTASGRLNLDRGGPSVFPPLPADLADFARYGRTGGAMWEENERPEDNRRRSIYTFQRRSLPQPMMLAFDSPVFNESCERRSVTTTALQALSMMNGDVVNEEAAHLAERVTGEAGADPKARIARAFLLVLGREPAAEESARFAAQADSLTSICRVLLNSNEFLYLD